MSRTLTFTQICDVRFNKSIEDLKLINANILAELNKINGIKVRFDNIREVKFDHEPNSKSSHEFCSSFRQNYYIQKNTRKTTWNDIYGIINKVKAVHYSFIPLSEFDYPNLAKFF